MPSHGAEARAARARRWLVAAALAGSMLALFGCAGVMPPPAPTATAEVPANWSADALAGQELDVRNPDLRKAVGLRALA